MEKEVPEQRHLALKMKKRYAFTLIELLLVVAIIITLSLIAIPSYSKSKRRATQKEALSNIKLITAAERIYRLEYGDYYDCNCTTASDCVTNLTGCNSLLRLMLNTENWGYNVTTIGDTGNKTANISAAAKSGNCTYILSSADFDSKNYSTSSGCI